MIYIHKRKTLDLYFASLKYMDNNLLYPALGRVGRVVVVLVVLVVIVVVVVVVVVGQTVGSISSKTLAYDCLYILELCSASLIATSLLGHLGDFLPSVCPSCS